MVHFEGERSFSRPLDEAAGKLGDASFLLSCVSDVEEVVSVTSDSAVWKLRPAFSFMSGSLTIAMTIIERIPGSSAKVKLFSKAMGGSATVIADLRFQSLEGGTLVRWSADLTEITGLLKMVPKGLIQSTAGKVIEETWSGIDAKLKA